MAETAFYVSPSGNDGAAGTLAAPFQTPARARLAVRGANAGGDVTVYLRGGVYHLDSALRLDSLDGGRNGHTVTWRAYGSEVPVLDGARPLAGWTKSDGNLWYVDIPEVKAGKWAIRQLFAGDRRLRRARLPDTGFFYAAGPLSAYASLIHNWDWDGVRTLRQTKVEAMCGFAYSGRDFQYYDGYRNAEVITWHSWECAWQTIRAIDTAKREVYFNSPSLYPVGMFPGHMPRYRIENVRAGLAHAGSWYCDREAGRLWYAAQPGEDPASLSLSAPYLEALARVEGAHDLAFRGVTFARSAYPMGYYGTAQYPDWPAPAKAQGYAWPDSFPPGFSDNQAMPNCGQALDLTGARAVAIEGCRFTGLGAYALRFGKRCANNRVVGNLFSDLGGGAILLGMDQRFVVDSGIPRSDAPYGHRIADNLIRRIGSVHPAAVGIWVAQSHHDTLAHNLIQEAPYSGISCGWTWGPGANYSDSNRIELNEIHHVVRELSDGAGIYTLGEQWGGWVRANHIHHIDLNPDYVGADLAAGLYFDQGSAHLTVRDNVLHDLSNKYVNFNVTDAGQNNFTGQGYTTDPKSPFADSAGLEPAYRGLLSDSVTVGLRMPARAAATPAPRIQARAGQLRLAWPGDFTASLYDSRGTRRAEVRGGRGEALVPLAGLARGLYVLRLRGAARTWERPVPVE